MKFTTATKLAELSEGLSLKDNLRLMVGVVIGGAVIMTVIAIVMMTPLLAALYFAAPFIAAEYIGFLPTVGIGLALLGISVAILRRYREAEVDTLTKLALWAAPLGLGLILGIFILDYFVALNDGALLSRHRLWP